MKFTLDTTLPAMLNVTSAEAAAGHRFAEAVFATGGGAAIFGVDDFITVTRQLGFEWEPIVAAAITAAASDLLATNPKSDRTQHDGSSVTHAQCKRITLRPNDAVHGAASRPERIIGVREQIVRPALVEM
jgi:hypothetical protein